MLLILIGYLVAFALTVLVWWVLSKVTTVRPYSTKAAAAIAIPVLVVLPTAALLILTREDVDLRAKNTTVILQPPSPESLPTCPSGQECPPVAPPSVSAGICPAGKICPDASIGAHHNLGLPNWTRNRKPRWGAEESGAPQTNDDYLKNLPAGSAVVRAPKQAIEYQPFDVSLRVAVKTLQDLLQEASRVDGTAAETTGVANVRMSKTMSAELVTADCTIEGSATAQWTQVVTETEETVWPWRVHCDTAGVKQIAIRLNTLLKVDGDEAPRVIDVAELPIEVHVDSVAWAMRHYKWITATLIALVPFLGWLAKRAFRNRQGKPAEHS